MTLLTIPRLIVMLVGILLCHAALHLTVWHDAWLIGGVACVYLAFRKI